MPLRHPLTRSKISTKKGGSTFCAVASLYLMNKLNTLLSEKQIERLKEWCLNRQTLGFNGRYVVILKDFISINF